MPESTACAPLTGAVVEERVVLSGQKYQLPTVTTTVTAPADSADVRRLTEIDADPVDRAAARTCLFGYGAPVGADDDLTIEYEGDNVTLTVTSDSWSGSVALWSTPPDGSAASLAIYFSPAFAPPSAAVQDGAHVSFVVVVPEGGSGDLTYSRPPARASDGEFTWEWVVGDAADAPDAVDASDGPGGADGAFELPEPDLEIQYLADARATAPISTWLLEQYPDPANRLFASDVLDYFSLLANVSMIILVLLIAVGLHKAHRWGGQRSRWRIILLFSLLVPLLFMTYPSAPGNTWVELRAPLLLAGSMWTALLALDALDREVPRAQSRTRAGTVVLVVASVLLAGVLVAAVVDAVGRSADPWPPAAAVDWPYLTAVAASSALTLMVVYRIVVVVFARQFWRGIGASAESDEFLPAVHSIRSIFAKALNALVITPRWLVLAALLFFVGWVSGVIQGGVQAAGWAHGLQQPADFLRGLSRYIPADLILPTGAALLAVALSQALRVIDASTAVILSGLAWAVVAGPPPVDVLGLTIPLGQLLLAFLVAAVCVVKPTGDTWPPPSTDAPAPPEPAGPEPGPVATRPPVAALTQARLVVAVKFSLLLSVFPVGYVLWGAAVSLPERTEFGLDAIGVFALVLGEILRWMLTGWIYAIVSPLLPGSEGPFKAVMLIVAWFVAAGAIELIGLWNGTGTGRQWLFPGLQFAVFLFVLTVLIDINSELVARPMTNWSQLMAALGQRYHIVGVRAGIVFVAPFALALIALVQQAVSGTGLEFVQNLLSGLSSLAAPS